MNMNIKTILTGMIQENCYVVSDDNGSAAVIDPGDDAQKIIRYLEDNNLTVEWILITHAHFDHIGALADVKEHTGAKVAVGEGDVDGIRFAPDLACKEGDVIEVGDLKFEVIETPGHTPGCVCYICGDAMFSGDTLFRESIGRTDMPGGNFDVMRRTLAKLRDLPYDDLQVYAGHMEPTTLEHERKYNPFIGK